MLLSDVDGQITHVFFSLPGYDREWTSRSLECIAGVMATLDPAVRCTVLCHDEDADAVRNAARGHPLDSVPWSKGWTMRIPAGSAKFVGKTLHIGKLPDSPDFTLWAQDSFLVVTLPAGSGLAASPLVVRRHGGLDADVPAAVAAHLGWTLETLTCPFEAANVLVDSRGACLGAAVRTEAGEERAREMVDWLTRAAGAGKGVRIVPADGQAPIRHQDLYLTLAGEAPADGRPTAVVGSLRLAARVLGRSVPADDDARLDAVSADLESAGYRVARIPLARGPDDPGRDPGWISYNNALVECRLPEDRRRVTMAAYGTDGGPEHVDLDAAAAEVWRGLGFEVRFVEGPFTWLSEFEGGVRCLTKVLARA